MLAYVGYCLIGLNEYFQKKIKGKWKNYKILIYPYELKFLPQLLII